MFFFFVAPFCSCPASLVSRKIFAFGPGCAKCVFLLRPVGRLDLSWCFFFALAPCRRPTGLLLPLPFPGAGAKKKHPGWCFFFALAPCRRPTGLLLPLPFAGAAAKKKTPWVVFFFCSGPVPARGFSFPCLSPGPEQKKTPWVVFFFCSGPAPAPNGASPSPAFPRGRSKKKTP